MLESDISDSLSFKLYLFLCIDPIFSLKLICFHIVQYLILYIYIKYVYYIIISI